MMTSVQQWRSMAANCGIELTIAEARTMRAKDYATVRFNLIGSGIDCPTDDDDLAEWLEDKGITSCP